jgi:hypothetical protein
MSSFFNQAKIINVYYNKGDRKPYNINGKPIAYIGEESIGANEATTIRFYLGEDLDSSTAIIVAKRANGDTRLDICEKFGTGVDSYYELTLNAWYAEFKGKMTIVFKVYNGTVTFDSSEMPTEITSTTGRIIVSDIFNLDVAYAPDASTLVPPYETDEYEDWFFGLSTKLDKAQSITVTGALPENLTEINSVTSLGVYNDRYFYVENEGVGKLFYIDDTTAIEVVWGVGTIQLTPSGNGDVVTGLEAGKLYWSEDKGTIVGGLYDDQVVGIGDGFFWFVKAKVGEANIAKGDVVQFAGNVGGQIVVKKADFAEITAQPDLLMGVAKHNIIAGNKGYIVAIGRLDNINTSGFSTPILYLSTTTAGQLTSTKPTNGFKGSIAAIGRASTGGGSNGFLLVRPNFIKGINEATDVLITSLTNKDILRWDSTSGRWENNADLTDLETNLQDYKDDIADGTIIVGKAENDKDGLEFDATYLKKADASTTYLTQANASSTYLTQANATAIYIPLSQKSIPNGVATLGVDGRVLPSQLPGSIGEVLEYPTLLDFPEEGAAEKIFIAVDTNKTYRWTGTQYVEISQSLALGETTETAFAGSRGVALETLTDNIVDGTQGLTDTRITNSATTIQPLIVNGIADTSTNLQEWQLNGSVVASLTGGGDFRTSFLSAISGNNNGRISFTSTGALISRNIADANNALRVNLANSSATGNIANFQFAGANKLEVTKDGFLNQNGVRFIDTNGTGNTHVGLTSGGASIKGEYNIAVGQLALSGINNAAATSNIMVGWNAGSAITSGNTNVGVGHRGAGSITTGFGNTFAGHNAGNNVSQLATAQNSTAIGNGSFTDASNQMVFGNASVTQFKFDRNSGALVLMPQTSISSATFPPLSAERTTTLTSGIVGVIRLLHTTTGDMTDGFGNVISFQIKDNLGVNNEVGAVGSIRSGADNSGRLSFQTANAGTLTEKMTIMPDGKVGIGTSAPATTLTLVTNANSDGIQVRRNSGTTNDYALLGFRITTTDVNVNFAEIRGVRTNRAVSADTDLSFHTYSNSVLGERMRIRDDGNVGIGTSSPGTKLTLDSGDLRIQSLKSTNATIQSIVFRNTNSSGFDVANIKGITGANIFEGVLAFDTKDSGGTMNERMRILSNGKVGIGTNAPVRLLSLVTSSNDDGLQIRRNSNTTNDFASLAFRINTSENNLNYGEIRAIRTNRVNQGDTDLSFHTFVGPGTLNERMRIRDDGNVGIGTTSPGAKLEVNGNQKIKLQLFIDNSTNAGENAIVLDSGGSTEPFYVEADGDVYNQNGTYGTSSDVRIKENIVNARNYTKDLMKLRVVKYSLKEEKAKKPTHLGFVAQEFEQVFPNMVSTGKHGNINDFKSIKTSVLIPMLVKTIQELNGELNAIKSKLGMPTETIEQVEPVLETNEPVVQPTPEPVKETFEPITNFEYDENE